MDLDIVRIECEISSDFSDQLMVALYGVLRNYDSYFQAIYCLNKPESCSNYCENFDCLYRMYFGQELSSDPEIVRLHQKPSVPFSLYIDQLTDGTSSLTVGIVVVGRAVQQLDFFYSALQKLIEECIHNVLPKHAIYSLRCFSLDYHGVRHEISSLSESVILLSSISLLQNTVRSECVKLTLKSPLRLLCNGSVAHSFDFPAFFRTQLRRCSSLWAYYGAGELQLDFASLSELARQVSVLEDHIQYSQPSWSKQKNRSGLTGFAECYGLADSMYSLLLLGSYFNAGKGASYGLGSYQVEILK